MQRPNKEKQGHYIVNVLVFQAAMLPNLVPSTASSLSIMAIKESLESKSSNNKFKGMANTCGFNCTSSRGWLQARQDTVGLYVLTAEVKTRHCRFISTYSRCEDKKLGLDVLLAEVKAQHSRFMCTSS